MQATVHIITREMNLLGRMHYPLAVFVQFERGCPDEIATWVPDMNDAVGRAVAARNALRLCGIDATIKVEGYDS